MIDVPDGLQWLAESEEGAAWLHALPRTVEQLADLWALEVGAPYPDGNASYVAPALQEGEPVVLKVQWPHPECEHEAEALRRWDGQGAVALLAHDVARHALLIERCTPGTHLSGQAPSAALDLLVDLLPRTWKDAGEPFRSLAAEAEGWAKDMPGHWEDAGRPCPRRLVDAALAFIRELAVDPMPQVLIHQDLHADNVLAAERYPWLVIDPKPLVGERAFSVAPIVRGAELGHERSDVLRRLDHLTAELDLDRERALAWTVAQTMAWSFGSDAMELHHQTCGWLLGA
ncbi:MAG: aminoglycoside/hydroxyurea antibiotic resistance kinase [Acidimicrobiales bacterium]|nr:aminoglycoside/hydroxyurea antibiotic resistance kinase [Acidimicrobiales bacterium]